MSKETGKLPLEERITPKQRKFIEALREKVRLAREELGLNDAKLSGRQRKHKVRELGMRYMEVTYNYRTDFSVLYDLIFTGNVSTDADFPVADADLDSILENDDFIKGLAVSYDKISSQDYNLDSMPEEDVNEIFEKFLQGVAKSDPEEAVRIKRLSVGLPLRKFLKEILELQNGGSKEKKRDVH